MLKKIDKDIWVAAGIFSAMLLVALVLVYWPQSRTLNRLRSQVTTETQQLRIDAEKARAVPEMRRRLDFMRSRYTGWDRKLPQKQDLGQFLSEISTQLRRKQLSSQVIEPGSPRREELFHTLPIIMKFEGSYGALVEFLQGMHEMERLTRVQTMKIFSNPAEEDVEIEVQLNIYFTES